MLLRVTKQRNRVIYLVKYANNKMYNSQSSLYVKLGEIKQLIQSGEKVQVTDYTTGEDLTAHVLSQVLTMTGNVNSESLRLLIEKGE